MPQSTTVGNPRPLFMDHRYGQRMPCRAHVQIISGASLGGAGRVRDVSLSGGFIETVLELPVYSRLALSVMGNESATHPVKIAATVVRVERDGVGVEWCDTPAGSICAVLGCISRCVALTTTPCQAARTTYAAHASSAQETLRPPVRNEEAT